MRKIYFFFWAVIFCFTAVDVNAEVLNEGFESETFVPEGWSIIEASGHSDYSGIMRSTQRYFEGNASAMFKHPSMGDNYLVTPQLRPENGETFVFRVIASDNTKNTRLHIKLSTTEPDQNSFATELASYSTSRDAGDISASSDWRDERNWKEKQIDLSAYVGQKIYIAFEVEGIDDLNLYIDAVSGVTLAGNPNCDAPTSLVVNSVAAETASFSWTGSNAGQYQYAYALNGAEVNWTAAKSTNQTNAAVSGLQPDAEYTFYVRSDCGSEQSSALSVVFKTPCKDSALPWKCDFESTQKLGIPDCWTRVSDNGLLYVLVDGTSSDDFDEQPLTYAHSGTHYLTMSGGGPSSAQLVVMPAFGKDLTNLKLFFWYNTGYLGSDYARPEVGYVTNPSDPKSFVNITTLAQTVDYAFVEQSLAGVPESVYLAFRFAGGNSNYGVLRIDDVEINTAYTAIENVVAPTAAKKYIENGKMIIVRDGIKFNALGQEL